MTTGIIIAAIVIVLAIVVAVGFGAARSGGRTGSLKRRFGPEYERVLARHDGDEAAADQELQERVERHGAIKVRPLTWQERERYAAEWTGVQERFVDSPTQAVAEARTLLERLVQDRGYPDAASGEQVDALSVHRPRHVQTYRNVRSADENSSTEELRTVLVQARELFDDLAKADRNDPEPGNGTNNDTNNDTNGKGIKHRAARVHLSSRSNS